LSLIAAAKEKLPEENSSPLSVVSTSPSGSALPLILSLPHGKTLTLGSPAALMGIVNVTPDSFSDGGAFASVAAAVAHGERLAAEGAAILDVGGESTRPKASPVGEDEEIARTIPVVAELSRRVASPISIDTMKARVAAAAIEAGASIVNDVWGFQKDPEMARVAADTGAAAVLMHNRASIDAGVDIVAGLLAFLTRSIDIALAAGVTREKLILDPGFGFGKTPAQNFELIRRLRELTVLGCPILLGVSRKSSIGGLTGQNIPAERLAGSLAAGLAGVANGAAILRVHDVEPHRQALQVLRAISAPSQTREAE
jgi:dihydropteroate synthase